MTVALVPHLSVTETDHGMVLLDEHSGRYWQLNATAATVLRFLLAGKEIDAAIEELRAQYPDRVATMVADVDAFIQALRDAELVRS